MEVRERGNPLATDGGDSVPGLRPIAAELQGVVNRNPGSVAGCAAQKTMNAWLGIDGHVPQQAYRVCENQDGQDDKVLSHVEAPIFRTIVDV
jgi:hypothetical protein